jgi:hypothetical protein
MTQKEYEYLYELIEKRIERTENPDLLREGYYIMNKWLDSKHLVRVDTRQSYDRTDVTEEDEAQGL